MSGSIRRRGPNSWQLRIYVGMDPQSGRQRWATRTVRGSERAARRELVRFADEASYARVHAGTLAQLLDRWFETASGDWAASTKRETKSRQLRGRFWHQGPTRWGLIGITDPATTDGRYQERAGPGVWYGFQSRTSRMG